MRSESTLGKWLFFGMLFCFIVLIGLAITWRSFLTYPLLEVSVGAEGIEGVEKAEKGSGGTRSVIFLLKPGTSASGFIQQAKQKEVFDKKTAFLFEVLLYVTGQQNHLQAGEYELASGITPKQLLKKLITGDVLQHEAQIIEGWTSQDFLNTLQENSAIESMLEDLEGKAIMQKLGYPDVHIEGWFFPDTYFFPRGTKDVEILKKAHALLWSHLEAAWAARDKTITVKTPYEALILSSIIEKETALEVERTKISGVFHRRLEKDMPLQADPTVIYGLGEKFEGKLTRKQLMQDTPYNTYVRKGLPPSPIALSSLKSIEAAMHPDNSDDLYFVAKGDGSHFFSNNLKTHNEAVAKYQLGKQSVTPSPSSGEQ